MFARLSVRELVVLLLAARNRGLTVATIAQARNEILRRETVAGDKR
jgi:hypothetical protein